MVEFPTMERALVGIGVTILKDGKILLGKRLAPFGRGEYAMPGGHLEFMESFEDCARREVREETGMELGHVKFQYLANVNKVGSKHYVQLGLVADWKSGDPENLEPGKCEGWDWYELDNLPEPLFVMTKWAIEAHTNGTTYRDS